MAEHARRRADAGQRQEGYSLIEVMVSVTILVIVSSTVFSGVTRLTNVNKTAHNRLDMHSGVRNATELLQQEIGQAGRIALPGAPTLTGGVGIGTATVGVGSTAGMFVGEQLTIDTGAKQETVTLTAVNAANSTITASFSATHVAGAPISVQGGFAAGVVPTGMANGSSGSALKIFGDIGGSGNMSYVEYTCDPITGNLYRRAMAYDAGAKPPVTVGQVLLDNVQPNPGGAPCFAYQERLVGATTFVVQVATTLTVRTADKDPVTGLYQTETKTLLNVAPRNVNYVRQLATLGVSNRVQPMPPTVQALLP